jgi:hypothetical protein
MRDATAQYESSESATHPREVGVPLPLGVHPGIEGIQHERGRPLHFSRFGQLPHSVQKASHSSLCGDAPTFCAAYPVGDRRNDVATAVREI